jgi:pimeloyl-ACP methyl ester carboxylesterase
MTTAITKQRKRANRTVGWWFKRIVLALVAFILVGAGVIFIVGARAKVALKAKYPSIGQMVDVGGYNLHLYCQGTVVPTVVMDAGAGSTGLYWSLVQSEIAKSVRTCVYDRAGYGWSEKSSQPRSIATIVNELHSLLSNANIPAPYVLVGHSIGGVIVRQYTQSYPQDVVGMVLVDSAQEKQFQRFPEEIVAATNQGLSESRRLELLVATGLPALNPEQVPLESKLPKEAAETYRALVLANSNHLVTARSEVAALERGDTEPVKTLGDLPLIVLSRGHFDPETMGEGISTKVAEQYEKVWQELQVELAELSSQGKQIIAEQSGHNIHLDQPELVISAIQDVLTETNHR